MSSVEKQCTLMCDEICLKKKLEYNKFRGYEDIGEFGRTEKLANYALMFYLRGIFYKWKMPFCYFATSGPVKSELLHNLIKMTLKKAIEIDLHPRILVFDQGSNNRSAVKLMGANKDQPYFYVEGKKIYICYDPPHVIKSLRNNFINARLKFFVRGKLISWQDIVKTVKIDRQSETTRTLTKVTQIHLTPNTFQKMRVKYATQLFSHSVASAIKTAAKTGELDSTTAFNTAELVESVNNIFDALNSTSATHKNPHKTALTVNGSGSIAQRTLENSIDFFQNIHVFEGSQLRTNIYCLEGFQLSIQAVLLLWNDLKSEGAKYFCTGAINQDCIENFFSVIRSRGGYNPTPTLQQFRISTQHNMHIRLQMSVETSNCDDDPDEILDIDINTENVDLSSITSGNEDVRIENPNESSNGSDDEDVRIIELKHATMETCSNVYMADYLLQYFKRRNQFFDCCKTLLKNNEELATSTEMFLVYKDYGISECEVKFLLRPAEEFANIVYYLLVVFGNCYYKYKCSAGVISNITREMLSLLNNHSDYPSCKDHKIKIINLLIKMNIYKAMKWETENANTKIQRSKPHRKVRILNNK